MKMGSNTDLSNGCDSDLFYEDRDQRNAMMDSLNKLRKEKKFCDIKIVVGEHNIPAHRAVLASASSYLFELFLRDKGDCQSRDVYKLKDIDYDSFNDLLDYMYSGRLAVEKDQVKAVYQAAIKLKMSAAAKACSKFMATHLSSANCLGVRKFAHDEELRQKTSCFIQNNIDEVTTSKHFYGLPRVKIEIVGVDEDLIESSNDKHMFQLVLSWARQNINPEKPRLEELTEQVNVLYLNPDNTLSDCKDFSSADQIVKEDDVINDYKKAKTKLSVPVKPKDSIIPTSPVHFRKFSIHPEEPITSKEWNIIATYQTKDNMYMAICLLNGEMATMSIHYRPRAISPTGSTPDGLDSPTILVSATQAFERHASLTPLAYMSSARCAFGLRVINGKLFACGGYDRGDCLISCEAFDLKSNMWTKLADMNTPRGRFATAAMNEQVFAIGGSNGHHEQRMVEIYNTDTNKWTLCSDAIKAKVSQGVCELNGKIYCIGGCVGQRSVPDCQVYDPQTNKWSNIASLNTARYQAAVCSFKGKLYAIGGTDSWSCLNSVEIYDPKTDKWSAGPLLNNPRRGAGCDVLNGKIYVVGGSDGTQSLRSIEILGQEKDVWSLGPALSIARANVGVAAYANRIFAVGGFSGKKFLDTMEYLDIDNNEWCSYLPVEDSVMAVRRRSQSSEKIDKGENMIGDTSVRNYNNDVNLVHCNGL